MIELTQQQLRTSDGLKSEVQMIQTLQGWKLQLQQADWLPDEWSEEWRNFIIPVLDQIALPPQQPTIVQK
jgi:hypothetical protein